MGRQQACSSGKGTKLTTYYTPRAGSISIYAIVLPEGTSETKETDGFLDHQDLHDCIKQKYGEDVRMVRYAELQKIIAERTSEHDENQCSASICNRDYQ